LGLLPFVVIELLLAASGAGRPDLSDDPLLGFSGGRPLFVRSDDGSRYEIARSRQSYFRPQSFAAVKRPDEFRVFCLGGSTVQGRPYAVETSLTTWLELSLQAADAGRHWRVVNCGGVSYASYRLVPILEEVLGYQPDLVVLYTGHNEFLEDRTYADIKRRPPALGRLQTAASRWRTYVVAQHAYASLTGRTRREHQEERDVVAAEVDAILDYQNGLAQYEWDQPWREAVVAHFELNIRRAVAIAATADVPLLLVNPVCNLRDCPPLKIMPRDGLAQEDTRRFAELIDEARSYYHGDKRDLRAAAERFERALTIDDRHAGARYELAECYDQLGMKVQAREAYLAAKDHDVCPLRMLQSMHEALLDVATDTNTPMVDVRELFERESRDGIPGGELLVDHVHPNVRGHQLIGEALAEWLIEQLDLRPPDRWRADRDRAYATHLASLDDIYFAQGQERLRALRAWSKGLVTATRPDEHEAEATASVAKPVEGDAAGN
jgi:lysophospholipase L1-like esterase